MIVSFWQHWLHGPDLLNKCTCTIHMYIKPRSCERCPVVTWVKEPSRSAALGSLMARMVPPCPDRERKAGASSGVIPAAVPAPLNTPLLSFQCHKGSGWEFSPPLKTSNRMGDSECHHFPFPNAVGWLHKAVCIDIEVGVSTQPLGPA